MKGGFLEHVGEAARAGRRALRADRRRGARRRVRAPRRVDPRFIPAGDVTGSARLGDHPYVARSPRERRAIADGLPVNRLRWRRRDARFAARAVQGKTDDPRMTPLPRVAGGVDCSRRERVRVAAPGPTRLVKGPYVTSFSDTTADVRFELDAPGPATLEIGPDRSTAPVRKVADTTASSMHVVHVTGLEAAHSYAYGIALGSTIAARGDVTTAPKPDATAPVRFLVSGDNRSDPSAHAAVVRAMAESPSDFLLNTGDMVEDGGNASDWMSFFTVEAPLLRERPLLLCIGNHELYDDESGANFAKYFGYPDASGRRSPTGRRASGQSAFLSQRDARLGLRRGARLARRRARPAPTPRRASSGAWPRPPRPWSPGRTGANQASSRRTFPSCSPPTRSTSSSAGHDHIYERGDARRLKYVVSGGGGAPLYRIGAHSPTRKAEAAYHFVEMAARGRRCARRRTESTAASSKSAASRRGGLGLRCAALPRRPPRSRSRCPPSGVVVLAAACCGGTGGPLPRARRARGRSCLGRSRAWGGGTAATDLTGLIAALAGGTISQGAPCRGRAPSPGRFPRAAALRDLL